MTPPAPLIHLVGAGPGDPLLLTRRAARLLERADVVVLDRPSLDAVASLAPPGAERIHVGRLDGRPAWPTEAIADLLAERARTGKVVVRLKSGDPFVCSRGAEEVDALRARGVACDVTPGVSAATAVPLSAGVPPGTSVVVASGDNDRDAVPVPWTDLADPAASIVVLTGRSHQGRIAARLQLGGLAPGAPVSLVHAATRPGQKVVAVTLADLGSVRLPPPAGFVVGPSEVARAHP